MKKFWLGLFSCMACSYSNAQTVSKIIPLNLTVPMTCDMRFNVSNIEMDFVRGMTSTASTTLTIVCTNGTPIVISITSKNNWSLVGKNHATESINYSLLYSGGGQSNGASINQTWSDGVPERVVMQGLYSRTPWIIPLQVTTELIPVEMLTDQYSDLITLSLNF